jgi:hypothetical protein
MNKVKSLLSILILAVCLSFLWEAERAHATVASFTTVVAGALTSEFAAGNAQEIREAFVSEYDTEWNQKVALGTFPDTAAGRRAFAATKISDYVQEIRRAYLRKQAVNALPTPTPIP